MFRAARKFRICADNSSTVCSISESRADCFAAEVKRNRRHKRKPAASAPIEASRAVLDTKNSVIVIQVTTAREPVRLLWITLV